MKKKLSFVTVIFTMLAVMCVSAYATITSEAKPISLDTPTTAKYSSTTDRNCYSFKPSQNGYYEIEINNPKEGQVIYIYDSKGNVIGWGNIDDFSGECKSAAKMTAKNTYYFVVYRSHDSSSYKNTVVVRKHSHNIIQTISVPATSEDDGYFIECCSGHCDYKTEREVASIKSVKLSTSKFTYNGKVITPTVTVKDKKGKVLKLNTDYTVKYSSGRKNPGRYAVKVTFKGDYTGSETLYFDILPGITSKISASQSTNAIKLTWSAVPGATGYRVFLYNAKTKKYTTLANTTKNTYTVSKLNPGTNYTFAVRAYSTVGGKVFWSAGYKTLATATKPNTPSLKVVAGAGKAVLTWNKQSGADGYVVYMSTSKDGKYTRIATVKGNSSVSYTKTGLTKGKTYYFKVAAYKTVGSTNIYSSFSAVRYVKIK